MSRFTPASAIPVTCREAAEALAKGEGDADEPTPLRYKIGQRVRVNNLCDFRSFIGREGIVVENRRFIVLVTLDGDQDTTGLRHESISAA